MLLKGSRNKETCVTFWSQNKYTTKQLWTLDNSKIPLDLSFLISYRVVERSVMVDKINSKVLPTLNVCDHLKLSSLSGKAGRWCQSEELEGWLHSNSFSRKPVLDTLLTQPEKRKEDQRTQDSLVNENANGHRRYYFEPGRCQSKAILSLS